MININSEEDITLKNINLSDLKPKAVQTIDLKKCGLNIANATKTGYLFCPEHGIFDMSYPNSKLRRGRVQGDGYICPTITCNPDNLWIIDELKETEDSTPEEHKVKLRIRKLTEREAFRLMGLNEDEIETIVNSDISSTAQYKMAGNSIVVNVLKKLFENLLINNKKQNNKKINALF